MSDDGELEEKGEVISWKNLTLALMAILQNIATAREGMESGTQKRYLDTLKKLLTDPLTIPTPEKIRVIKNKADRHTNGRTDELIALYDRSLAWVTQFNGNMVDTSTSNSVKKLESLDGGKSRKSSLNGRFSMLSDSSDDSSTSMEIRKYPENPEEGIHEFFAGRIIAALTQKNKEESKEEEEEEEDEIEEDSSLTEDGEPSHFPIVGASHLCFDKESGRLGFAQDAVGDKESTKPLHKEIKTSSWDIFGADRCSLFEASKTGHDKIVSWIQEHNTAHEDLITIITISLLLGDYSVHSGNLLWNSDDITKIDFGAALRNILNPNNNRHLGNPVEYQNEPTKLIYQNYLRHILEGIGGYRALIVTEAEKYETQDILLAIVQALEEMPPAWVLYLHDHMPEENTTMDEKETEDDAGTSHSSIYEELEQRYASALETRLALLKTPEAPLLRGIERKIAPSAAGYARF